MAEVALVEVSKSYGAVEAVRDLSLSIAHGEFVVLLGPTGAGKTTTLRLIAGLERPDRGNVLIQGRTVTNEVPAERDVAFVFQQYSLYPHLTVYDNLAFPLRSPRGAWMRRQYAVGFSRYRSYFISSRSSATGLLRFPAVKCSGSPSGARWSASPPSI
jgi:ABC-type sugar transport systems, ATPase components